MNAEALIPPETIASRILVIRGQRVLLDADLAALYGATTKRLNEQVKRNTDRFPADFAFELTPCELDNLRSQFATSSWGGRRSLPRAFTEHGALMVAAILNTPAAVQVSLQVVRAFVRIRQLLATNEDLARRVTALEKRSGARDADLRALAAACQGLLEEKPQRRARQRIGFQGAVPAVEDGAVPAEDSGGHSGRRGPRPSRMREDR